MADVLNHPDAMRELAREAARAFCTQFGFSAQHLQALDGPPLFEAVPVERDGRQALAFRWLGGGRGEPYVQPEVSPAGDAVTVYGGFGHQEFGPWPYRRTEK
jgi:hypothetical protein